MTTTDGCNGSDKKSQAREIFLHALSQASVAGAFSRQVHCARGILRVCDDLYDLQAYSRVFVVSIGKAGHTMAEALTQIVGEGMIEGIVACPDDPPFQVRGFRYFRGGHPTPNAESVAAASAILRALNAQTAASLVIFLISGGGSSMVEMAMDVESARCRGLAGVEQLLLRRRSVGTDFAESLLRSSPRSADATRFPCWTTLRAPSAAPSAAVR